MRYYQWINLCIIILHNINYVNFIFYSWYNIDYTYLFLVWIASNYSTWIQIWIQLLLFSFIPILFHILHLLIDSNYFKTKITLTYYTYILLLIQLHITIPIIFFISPNTKSKIDSIIMSNNDLLLYNIILYIICILFILFKYEL